MQMALGYNDISPLSEMTAQSQNNVCLGLKIPWSMGLSVRAQAIEREALPIRARSLWHYPKHDCRQMSPPAHWEG
jgi:hypothetical protein